MTPPTITTTTTRTPPSTSLTLLRLSIIILALLMLLLDSVHISQLKRTLTQYFLQQPPHSPPLPWPFSYFLSNPTSPDSPSSSFSSNPSETDLHGYYLLHLLIPDLFVISMMAWLIWGRKCRDRMYHVGLRCGFFGLVVLLVLWWPVMEIEMTKRYTRNMYDHLMEGGNRRSLDSGAMGGVEGGESSVGWKILTRRQQQQQQQQVLGEGVKDKGMQGRVRLLDEDVLLFPEIVSLSPAGPATTELVALAAAFDKDTTATTIGNTKTVTKRADAPPLSTLSPSPPTPKRVYEWTAPSAGSVYFCFLNHLDIAPYAPFINCGVYRTRNVFAFLLLILLMGEMVLSALKGEMSIMEAVTAATAAGSNTDEGSDSASSVSSTGATMGGNSAIRAIPPIPAGVNSAIPPIPVGARSAIAGMKGGRGAVAGLRGGASGGGDGGGITSARGSGIAGQGGERGIALKDIL